jgi:hypothetical protein
VCAVISVQTEITVVNGSTVKTVKCRWPVGLGAGWREKARDLGTDRGYRVAGLDLGEWEDLGGKGLVVKAAQGRRTPKESA